jgi:hypothetical protein
MMTARTFTTAEADRLLGLADQFLQDWAETAHRHGEAAKECEERAAEWDAIRPLLALAPRFLALLEEADIAWGGDFANDNPVDGGDLVEWFAQWLPEVHTAIAAPLRLLSLRFSQRFDASLWTGAPRHQSRDSFVSGFLVEDPPETKRILADPEGLSARPGFSASSENLLRKERLDETLDRRHP